MSKYTNQQWLTLLIFGIASFFNSACVSLQAPFYPRLAENRGATATQYGFVFGVFELVVFIVSPIYGNFISKIGPNFMFHAGIFTTGTTCILFGMLDKIYGISVFIGLSFAIRIVEALGNAAYLTAAFSIIAQEFPDNIGAAFATIETFFGLGMISGPTIGGALYELSGYTLPFIVMGSILLTIACTTVLFLPHHSANDDDIVEQGNCRLIIALSIPSITIAAFGIVSAAISIGFLQATLEPHLRPLGLSPLGLGLMFIINGGVYAFSAPCWGFICDKKSPLIVTFLGSLFVVISFLLIGPAPFIPLELSLIQSIIALLLHGIGLGAILVSTFSCAQSETVKNGFPDSISTYGMVSSIWTSTFALGAFIGPTIGGVLMDIIGFSWGSMFVVALHITVAIIVLTYILIKGKKKKENERSRPNIDVNETTPLIKNNK